jgi:hypothetical protein
MPIETCFYCKRVSVCSMWSQSCSDCFQQYVKPLLHAGIEFEPQRESSLRSYPPENWRELLGIKEESEPCMDKE